MRKQENDRRDIHFHHLHHDICSTVEDTKNFVESETTESDAHEYRISTYVELCGY